MNKKLLRHNKLLQIVKTQGLLPIRTLAAMLEVSEMTVRRDLEILENSKHTIDANNESIYSEYNLLTAVKKANEQKELIGRFAVSLINNNDVIIIDTGSTTAKMLPYVPDDYNLTVICYNANVLLELRYKAGIQLFMCGGVYHQNTEMFESPESIQLIKRIRANKVFLSAAGVHEHLGITCSNAHEVLTKNAVMQSSSEKILLADSSKFGQIRSSFFSSISEIDTIVTDSGLSDEWKEIIMKQNIKLHLV